MKDLGKWSVILSPEMKDLGQCSVILSRSFLSASQAT